MPLDDEGNIEDFENLAPDMLGVLKADVDNMGLLFHKGLQNPGRLEKDTEDVDRKSVARYLTMSRMIDLFFCSWLKETLKKGVSDKVIVELLMLEGIDSDRLSNYLKSGAIDFRKIYTVYSAGDDLVLVGPWQTMIIFTIYLNQQFRKYTANNEWFTLSAGLTFVKPKFPISAAIKQADGLLNDSKKAGKDRITLFGTTVAWENLPKLVNSHLFLNEKVVSDENTGINTAFLHRLFKYHQMALSYLDENKIEGVKYVSALSYDVGRNIVKWDKDGKITKGKAEYEFFQHLINEKPCKDCSIYNFKIPLFWTLYRNRKDSRP